MMNVDSLGFINFSSLLSVDLSALLVFSCPVPSSLLDALLYMQQKKPDNPVPLSRLVAVEC